MKLLFKINYRTDWGQNVRLLGSLPELGGWDVAKAPHLHFNFGGDWELEVEVPANTTHFEYKYFLWTEQGGHAVWEQGDNHSIAINYKGLDIIEMQDIWRSPSGPESALHTSAFTQAVFNHAQRKADKPEAGSLGKKGVMNRLRVTVPRLNDRYVVAISGDGEAFGNWDAAKVVPMTYAGNMVWEKDVVFGKDTNAAGYKYVIFDPATKKVVEWEAGDNRYMVSAYAEKGKKMLVRYDDSFRYQSLWKGSGVAIPVFSLRSQNSFGVGEFTDIKLLVDWAKKVGLKMVQILPVNDTVATHTWTDSYPYAAISVFALHPLFLNLEAMGKLSAKVTQQIFKERQASLNQKTTVDYDLVMKAKSRYFKIIYDEQKGKLLKSPEFLAFVEENKAWLQPYAAFCFLRDLYGTPDFTKWDRYQTITQAELDELTSPKAAEYDDIAIHYFIQYHLHLQMLDAATYARNNGIVLKGDIPIGIYRFSVDAWVNPHLYNMDAQAGAPPDAFAAAGQNWGFPTYNWEEMGKDGFQWWRSRLQNMAKYFDAFRIDHILGFFRIWQISMDQVEGIFGVFNPALPLHKHEIEGKGIWFDYDRFCKPYIREHFLAEFFGKEVEYAKENFLEETSPGQYRLKPAFDTQRKVEAYFATDEEISLEERAKRQKLQNGLFGLISQVLFLEQPGSNGTLFNPRSSLHFTHSYRELDWNAQRAINELYTHYFYHRHEQFWRDQAMVKLPAIAKATNMLICGEDLGMVPDCVPGVMSELGLLSLEIQRMPKNPKITFGHPSDYPYLSVSSPSTHDMPTIRGWWEEDYQRAQQFYGATLGHHGPAPYFCEPWVAREILVQHLYGSSMWTVFPLQDFLAIDGKVRRKDPKEEQINVPANPKHYWRYRLHLSLEELLAADEFNNELRALIDHSGRNAEY